ncbi:MAG: hypothetical protein Q4D87_00210 [Actinomycetaceae bacterium]|nr:hypothetical protein [Actinomycetaceae bacterium]
MMEKWGTSIWRYHAVRHLRLVSTWVVVVLVALTAVTSGVITEYTPAILESVAGEGMSELLAATMPDPSWEQAYAQWAKNLAQAITLALVTVNALGAAALVRNGDIPFILTGRLSRSKYLSAAIVSNWLATGMYALLGAVLTWLGTIVFFPEAPLVPVMLATLVWALEVALIAGFQFVAATWRPGIGAPLLTGLGMYFLITVAGISQKVEEYSPVGLRSLSRQLIFEPSDVSWVYSVGSSVAALVAIFAVAVYFFERAELE